MEALHMDLQLTNKTAIVTGGSRGIGKAIATALAAEGVDVALVSRTASALEAAAAEIAGSTGRRALPLVADTGDTDAVNAAVERAVTQLGRIDILVNCAARPGGAPPKPGVENLPDETFAEEINVKVLGYLRCARAVTPHMKAQRWGRIINISGLAARQTGNPIGSIRNVAVAALTKNLADELGPFGINVTCVHPGLTWTESLHERLEHQAAGRGETLDDARARMAEQNAVRRIIEAEDIAAIVAFLASPRAVAITGDAIAAGGGVGRAIHY
jgi:NAD(P)-dependent dehydrogenase (short-subunit alcohol dehydrogenase family)